MKQESSGSPTKMPSSKPQADMDLKQMFFTQLEREAAVTHGTLERVSKRQFHQVADPVSALRGSVLPIGARSPSALTQIAGHLRVWLPR
jgi:hypothetical protein